MSHTPRPWTAEMNPYGVTAVVLGPDNGKIASVKNLDDARLMASAPDLQAEVERLKELNKELVESLGDVTNLCEAAMSEANNDGAEYDIEGELKESKELLAKAKEGK